jgi:hypothetical protein
VATTARVEGRTFVAGVSRRHHSTPLGKPRDALGKWLDYWKDALAGDLSVERQEDFVKHLSELGIKRSTIQRTINFGKATISRAFKRGE